MALIASQLASSENGVLLIDELESSIHVKALEDNWKWLLYGRAESNIQLFVKNHP